MARYSENESLRTLHIPKESLVRTQKGAKLKPSVRKIKSADGTALLKIRLPENLAPVLASSGIVDVSGYTFIIKDGKERVIRENGKIVGVQRGLLREMNDEQGFYSIRLPVLNGEGNLWEVKLKAPRTGNNAPTQTEIVSSSELAETLELYREQRAERKGPISQFGGKHDRDKTQSAACAAAGYEGEGVRETSGAERHEDVGVGTNRKAGYKDGRSVNGGSARSGIVPDNRSAAARRHATVTTDIGWASKPTQTAKTRKDKGSRSR